MLEAKQNLDETKHFVGLDIEIEKLLELKYVNARFGRLPKDSYVKLEIIRMTLILIFRCVQKIKLIIGAFTLLPLIRQKKLTEFFKSFL